MFYDFQFLKNFIPKTILNSIIILGLLVFPIYFTIQFRFDKITLDETFNYLYTPNYSSNYKIDTNSLANTLNRIKENKDRNRSPFGGSTPYISSYFNWIVLNNLTVSDDKIKHIEKVFLSENEDENRFRNFESQIQNEHVKITKINTESKYDSINKTWKSWVNFEIKNNNPNGWNDEFATNIELPTGCYISDYYLYVGDKKEMAILAEKKAALWIFNQIRNTFRDPGLLHYNTGNNVAFRVYPFQKDELRKTGIEFIHNEPVTLKFDDKTVQLGTQNNDSQIVETNNSLYIPKIAKQKLKKVKREPYLHFLVDVSACSNEHDKTLYINRINKFVKTNNLSFKNAKLSLVNTYTKTYNWDKDWENKIRFASTEGGYFVERSFKSELYKILNNKPSSVYPVFVTVTDSIQNAIIQTNFQDFKQAFPENEYFYNLVAHGEASKHSLVRNPLIAFEKNSKPKFNDSVYVFTLDKNYYVNTSNEANLLLKNPTSKVELQITTDKNWKDALDLNASWISQNINPNNGDELWVKTVQNSFKSRILTPFTAYLVVENEAQKAMLKKKQEQALNSNKSLDLGEEPQAMSEPEWFIFGVFLLGLAYFKRKK